jgi:hypothetical protein
MMCLAHGRVHFALPLFAWFFKVTMFPQVRQNTGFFALLLEPLQCPFEALVIVNDDFWHSLAHPSQAR